MCGIAGHVDFAGARSAEASEKLAQAMGDAIRHRGPDSGGVLQPVPGAWLSFRRLAIVDTSEAGNQPMSTPDGLGHIVFNGEAYNAADLRPELEAAGYRFRGHSDTEAILYGCQHWGVEETAKRLIGMFAFAFFDARSNSLTLVVDRLGKKPIYWFQTDRTFAFGSELKALTVHPDCPREIDRASVAEYLRLLYVPAPRSIYAGVRKLEPGNVLTLQLGARKAAIEPFWSLRDAIAASKADPFRGSIDEAVEETERLLLDATRIRLISDVPLGAFLSGGIDSSTVVALMQEIGSKPVRTFSIGYAQRDYDESADAERIAKHLGTDHMTFRVEPADAMAVIPSLPSMFDEPFADTSQIPTYLVAKLAREHVTVALTGDGGDEVFAGYNRHVAASGLLGRLSALPYPIRAGMAAAMTSLSPGRWQALAGVLPDRIRPRAMGEKLHKLAPLLQLSEQEQYRRIVSHWDDPVSIVIGAQERPSPIDSSLPDLDDAVERMRFLDLAIYLPGDILTKVDRATMAASLEARAPLLDHRLVEWSFRVPTSVHIQDGQGKWLLRRILEKRVPRALFERPKTGFGIPLGEWLRGPLRDWAEDLLSEDRLRSTNLLRPEPIRKLWQNHLSGAANGQYLLWPVLILMAWLAEWGNQSVDARAEAAIASR